MFLSLGLGNNGLGTGSVPGVLCRSGICTPSKVYEPCINVGLRKQLKAHAYPTGHTAGTQQRRHEPSPINSEPRPFGFTLVAGRPSPGWQAYLRPLLGPAVKGVSDHPRLGPCNAALHEFLIHILLHEGPGASTAALALVKEKGEVGLLYSPVHCEEGAVDREVT